MRKNLPPIQLFLIGLSLIFTGSFSYAYALDLPPVTVNAANSTELINQIIVARSSGQETIINLTGTNYNFTNDRGEDSDGNALPIITSGINITINGNGQTLTRSGSTNFRFFVVSDGILTLNDLTLSNGQPAQGKGGGAIYCSGGTVTLNRCTFFQNDSDDNDGADGGAIENDGGSFVIQDCTFEENFASGLSGLRGGGLHQSSGDMEIINSLFFNNSAVGRGGGLALEGGSIDVYNSTFFRNGDEAIYQNGGVLDIRHCTITENDANSFSGSAGGIVSESGTLLIAFNIIAENDPAGVGTNSDIIFSGSFTDNGHNLVGNSYTGIASSTQLIANALLAATLTNNGGNTRTLRPTTLSPAVDAGVESSSTLLKVDQRGFVRDEFPDIGAFELNANAPVASPYQVTSTGDAGAGTLREAINNANYAEAIGNSPYSIDLTGVFSAILLDEGLPPIKSNTSITGSSTNLTVINGQSNGPILETKGAFSITLSNIDFTGGISTNANLGAIFSNFNSQVSITNCIFRDSQNAASNADGIVYNSGGKIKFNTCLFQNNNIGPNSSSTAQGVLHSTNGTLELIACSIQNNSGSARTIDGGAIFLESSTDSLFLNNCTIYNNDFNAQNFCFGAGIFIQNGYADIVNTSISGNDVSVNGGTNNALGGGLLVKNGIVNVNLRNSIIAGNSRGGSTSPIIGMEDVQAETPITSSQNNLIGVISGYSALSQTGLLSGFTASQIFDAVQTTNPKNLAQVLPLLAGSPAINAGTNGSGVLTTDQLGNPVSGNRDLGSVEFQGPSISTDSVDRITATTARLNATVNSTGAVSTLSERGGIFYLQDGTTKVIGDAGVTQLSASGSFGTGSYTTDITGLSTSTQYTVRSFVNDGMSISYGNTLDFWTLASEPENSVPNLDVTVQIGSSVTLGWSAAGGNNISGYIIITSPTASLDASEIQDGISPGALTFSNGAGLASNISNPNQTTAIITGVDPLVSTTFFIIPYNWDGSNDGTYNYFVSSPLTFVTVNQSALPNAPDSLVATVVSTDEIRLNWRDNSDNEQSFEIFRSEGDNSSFERIDVVNSDRTSYRDTDLDPSTTYFYRIWAGNNTGNSPLSNEASATTLIEIEEPSLLRATPLSSSVIVLTWLDNSDNETNFEIQREALGIDDDFSTIATVAADVTTYLDSNVVKGVVYLYRVRALIVPGGSSEYTLIAGAKAADVPEISNDLVASIDSNNDVLLNWSDPTEAGVFNDEVGYLIERASILDDEGIFSEIGVVGRGISSYTDSTVLGNQLYNYRVRSYNDEGVSPYSNEVSIVTPLDVNVSLPQAPFDLTAEAVSETQITLRWLDNSDNEDFFIIERSFFPNTGFQEIARVERNTRSHNDLELTVDSIYYYRVQAGNSGGFSSFSNIAFAIPACNLTVAVSVNQTNIISNICVNKGALLELNTNVVNATYQWLRNNQPIDGANQDVFLATQDGEYNCRVIAGGCLDSAAVPTVVLLEETFTIEIFFQDNFIFASVVGADAYQWYYDFEPIEGATGDSFRPNRSGSYYVIVSSGECAVTSDLFFYEITDVPEDFSSRLSISPNPAQDEVQLDIESGDIRGEYEVWAIDLLGNRILLKRDLKNSLDLIEKIDISQLPAGMYYLEFRNGDKRGLKKIIKN